VDYNRLHTPVLVQETLSYLNVKDRDVVVDCTLGMGGHTEAILKAYPEIQVIGMDIDEEALAIVRERLAPFHPRVKIVKESYVNLNRIFLESGEVKFAALLFDLGVSLLQLTSPHRGFSIQESGSLDMRMNRSYGLPLSKILSRLSLKEITTILESYGEEEKASRTALAIYRERHNIKNTADLRRIVEEIKKGRGSKIHPATRVFQAFRTYINKELENLTSTLSQVSSVVKSGGRVIVISYHSLEDRIVKRGFREEEKAGRGKVITQKVVTPTRDEIKMNPRARSAKMRVLEVC